MKEMRRGVCGRYEKEEKKLKRHHVTYRFVHNLLKLKCIKKLEKHQQWVERQTGNICFITRKISLYIYKYIAFTILQNPKPKKDDKHDLC